MSKKKLCEHAPNSEWLARQSCLNLARTALPSPLEVCLLGWIKSEAYTRKVDTTDESFARILGAAARIKTREYQLRLATHDLRARFVKCINLLATDFFFNFSTSCI